MPDINILLLWGTAVVGRPEFSRVLVCWSPFWAVVLLDFQDLSLL